MKITVDKTFIKQRDERKELYNNNGRSDAQLLRDIECELYEYHMIKKGWWLDDDRWQVDGVAPYGTVDVKCISGYYNIGRKKMLYLFQQKDITDYFYFIEWVKRPNRLLKSGDEVEFNFIGREEYDKVIKRIQVSFKADGYYYDARKILKNRKDRFPG